MCACTENDVDIDAKKNKIEEQMQYTPIIQMSDTTLWINHNGFKYSVAIKLPEGISQGTILVLPGWNFPATNWCDSTTLCTSALERGYILVFPDMKKSIYSESIYKETRSDWQKYPTRKWLRDSVILRLQTEFNLFTPEGNNYVLGLSTGGRGALLLALDLPNVFSGCATLSGDYDQSMFPYDNLYIGYYGKMKEHEDRWKNLENPIQLMLKKDLNVPLYIGHGMKDAIVPYKHFELLKEFIENIKPEVKVIYHSDSLANHNYTYWNSEVESVLEFFNESKK